MKKRDFLLIGAVLALALLCWVVPRAAGIFAGKDASRVRITVGGEEYGTYSLSEDQTIEIHDTNVCEIKDGEVNMIQADCPDQLCIHQGPIRIQGETIVCLPNRVVVEITGKDKEEQLDGVVQ